MIEIVGSCTLEWGMAFFFAFSLQSRSSADGSIVLVDMAAVTI